MNTWTTPSSKVVVSALMAILAGLVTVVAADTAILEPLPDALEAVAVGAVVALAGYLKRENNPAPSSGKST